MSLKSLKIMHTGDVHLGKKFSNYPGISEKLEKARYQALENVVREANSRECNILAVAGDLFDKPNMPEVNIIEAVNILSRFSGDVVLVLPGNHDYDRIDIWRQFKEHLTGKILLLEEKERYDLRGFDLAAAVYPAPCDDKHSAENTLGWINSSRKKEGIKYEIGMAHGALDGVSPDMTDDYFKMNQDELRSLGMDVWLLGHTHMPYPDRAELTGQRILNSGTPEPDGMNCSHAGYAWYIEIDEKKNITAKQVKTGSYLFLDKTYRINSEEDFENLVETISAENPAEKVVRLKLSGRIEEELYSRKNEYYREIRERTAYARIIDADLNLKITSDKIAEEFTPGSLPYEVLHDLMDDEEALQLAYEFIQEVKQT